jgi:hypothetical protein
VLGNGRRLFTGDVRVGDLRLISTEQSGAAALLCYEKAVLRESGAVTKSTRTAGGLPLPPGLKSNRCA